jgi:hypothetical protein
MPDVGWNASVGIVGQPMWHLQKRRIRASFQLEDLQKCGANAEQILNGVH